MTAQTKKELLATAKELNIAGRHEMTKEALEAAILEAQTEEAPMESLQVDVHEFVGNYIPTLPFRGREYAYVGTHEEAYAKLPPQAKKIFDFMRDKKIVARGDMIVKLAVEAGYLKTAQVHAVLFAFYARKLEEAGIRLNK